MESVTFICLYFFYFAMARSLYFAKTNNFGQAYYDCSPIQLLNYVCSCSDRIEEMEMELGQHQNLCLVPVELERAIPALKR